MEATRREVSPKCSVVCPSLDRCRPPQPGVAVGEGIAAGALPSSTFFFFFSSSLEEALAALGGHALARTVLIFGPGWQGRWWQVLCFGPAFKVVTTQYEPQRPLRRKEHIHDRIEIEIVQLGVVNLYQDIVCAHTVSLALPPSHCSRQRASRAARSSSPQNECPVFFLGM